MSFRKDYLALGAVSLAAAGLVLYDWQNTPQVTNTPHHIITEPEHIINPTEPWPIVTRPPQGSTRSRGFQFHGYVKHRNLPRQLDFMLRTHLADELAHYENWDIKETFLGQYKNPVLVPARKFRVKDLTAYLDANQQVKSEAEKLFGIEVATLYSLETSQQNPSLDDLVTKDGGPTVDTLGDTLWQQTGKLWQEKGKRDLVQRMFLDQDVETTLMRELRGKTGIASFYNDIAGTYLQAPPSFLQDLGTYYTNTEESEERDRLFTKLNDVFVKNRISYERLGSRVLDVLQQESRWDALGAFILHHKNPRAFQLEKKK